MVAKGGAGASPSRLPEKTADKPKQDEAEQDHRQAAHKAAFLEP